MQPQKGGIFDRQTQTPQLRPENKPETVSSLPKQDFKDPVSAAAELTAKTRNASQAALRSKELMEEAKTMEMIEGINAAGGGITSKDTEQALAELDKITPEDLKMAEAMIFNGYAEKIITIPNFSDHTITVCTVSPGDLEIVDEMIFDLVRLSENKTDNTINLSDAVVKTAKSLYTLALGYKGMDGTDIHPDKVCQIGIIKKGIESLSEYEIKGDVKGLALMKEEIKKSIRRRSYMLKKLPTPIIDFISQEKYAFDQKMFSIMSMKNLIAKS